MGGIRLTTPGLRAKAKRMQGGRAWPDLFIAQPIPLAGYEQIPLVQHCGLFIELKKDGVKIFKKDGTMVANEHYREQAAVLEKLRRLGYMAEFSIGFDATKDLIDNYLHNVS